jgi:hypothetical protein
MKDCHLALEGWRFHFSQCAKKIYRQGAKVAKEREQSHEKHEESNES